MTDSEVCHSQQSAARSGLPRSSAYYNRKRRPVQNNQEQPQTRFDYEQSLFQVLHFIVLREAVQQSQYISVRTIQFFTKLSNEKSLAFMALLVGSFTNSKV